MSEWIKSPVVELNKGKTLFLLRSHDWTACSRPFGCVSFNQNLYEVGNVNEEIRKRSRLQQGNVPIGNEDGVPS